MCVCVRACVHACVRVCAWEGVCVCLYVRACVRVRVYVCVCMSVRPLCCICRKSSSTRSAERETLMRHVAEAKIEVIYVFFSPLPDFDH